MKILVFSDSHGNDNNMAIAVKKYKNADVIIFCGDGHRDIKELGRTFPKKKIYAVKGNCDWCNDLPLLITVELGGKRVMITHGHAQYVKDGIERLIALGHREKADIVLFGHTHRTLTTADGMMLIMNPGSIGFDGSYGIIDIDENTGIITANEYPDNYGPVVIRPQANKEEF